LVLIFKFFYFYGHINDELLLKHSIDIDILNQCTANDNSSTLPSSPLPLALQRRGETNKEEQSTKVALPLDKDSVTPPVVGEELNNNSSPSKFSNVEGKSTSVQQPPIEGVNTRDLSIRIASAASDGGIMATAIAAGAKLAAKAPTPASKIAATLGGVGLGALAIGTKNIMSNVTSAALGGGKNNTFINLDFFNLFPAQMTGSGLPNGEGGLNLFNLTGNSALDLIHMLVLFQLLQLLFLSIIIYNSIIMLINEDYIEKILLRFVPLNKTIRGYILK